MVLKVAFSVDGREIPLDDEGYLLELADWSPAVAEAMAAESGIALGEAHWEVIRVLQDFYRETGVAPATRPLVKLVGQRLGPDKGRSIYLLQLFPDSPAKLAARLAGLPRPDNCL